MFSRKQVALSYSLRHDRSRETEEVAWLLALSCIMKAEKPSLFFLFPWVSLRMLSHSVPRVKLMPGEEFLTFTQIPQWAQI